MTRGEDGKISVHDNGTNGKANKMTNDKVEVKRWNITNGQGRPTSLSSVTVRRKKVKVAMDGERMFAFKMR